MLVALIGLVAGLRLHSKVQNHQSPVDKVVPAGTSAGSTTDARASARSIFYLPPNPRRKISLFRTSVRANALAAHPSGADERSHCAGGGECRGKVVTLIEDLKAKIDADGATEQKIYDKFACWCESTTQRKAPSFQCLFSNPGGTPDAVDSFI